MRSTRSTRSARSALGLTPCGPVAAASEPPGSRPHPSRALGRVTHHAGPEAQRFAELTLCIQDTTLCASRLWRLPRLAELRLRGNLLPLAAYRRACAQLPTLALLDGDPVRRGPDAYGYSVDARACRPPARRGTARRRTDSLQYRTNPDPTSPSSLPHLSASTSPSP